MLRSSQNSISIEYKSPYYYIFERIDNYKKPKELWKSKNLNEINIKFKQFIEAKA